MKVIFEYIDLSKVYFFYEYYFIIVVFGLVVVIINSFIYLRVFSGFIFNIN